MSEQTRLAASQNIPMSTPTAVGSAPLRSIRRSSSAAGAAAEDGGSNARNMNPSRDANRGPPPSAADMGGAAAALGLRGTRHSVVAAALSAPGAGSSKRKSQHGSSKQPKQPRPRVEEVVAGLRKTADARRLPKRGVAGMPLQWPHYEALSWLQFMKRHYAKMIVLIDRFNRSARLTSINPATTSPERALSSTLDAGIVVMTRRG